MRIAFLLGNTDVLSAGVGAHQSHLKPSSWHRTVTCDDCHNVPTGGADRNIIAPELHIDGDVSD